MFRAGPDRLVLLILLFLILLFLSGVERLSVGVSLGEARPLGRVVQDAALQGDNTPFSYLDLEPRICPTTRFDNPIPTIWTEVARPMAVPSVA
ncbi:hypothetical protein EYF80_051410 [Liparis tanakae]|uniref:Uncharacterized protein n=1 Tax=Liparis tanakae TaxID=230148 RepID=A0A4Z2FCE6_9TELE|nr:hypothetical protein EYF80_051410 [Liparis tanakae]